MSDDLFAETPPAVLNQQEHALAMSIWQTNIALWEASNTLRSISLAIVSSIAGNQEEAFRTVRDLQGEINEIEKSIRRSQDGINALIARKRDEG